ncbi:hypothetical protein [Halovenus aranensis]|nr:hypothetical protein [Halovenus aranensis]
MKETPETAHLGGRYIFGQVVQVEREMTRRILCVDPDEADR